MPRLRLPLVAAAALVGHQFKYHAPGVGVVKIVGKGGVEQETLVLTKLHTLTELDKRAYKLAKPVYAKTPFASLR